MINTKKSNDWETLAKNVESQKVKQVVYDDMLFNFCGNVLGKKLLDFGCGTGEIAIGAKKVGAETTAYDPSKNMRNLTAARIGNNSVYKNVKSIPSGYFDIVFSNLVICVVEKKQVIAILSDIRRFLNKNGIAFIGFCNPLAFGVHENSFQRRLVSGIPYEMEHDYRKIIKDGGFMITEKHRPLEFYEHEFRKSGFRIDNVSISKDGDFVIYKLVKFSTFKSVGGGERHL